MVQPHANHRNISFNSVPRPHLQPALPHLQPPSHLKLTHGELPMLAHLPRVMLLLGQQQKEQERTMSALLQ